MSLITNILKPPVDEIAKTVGEVIDNITTTDDEKLKAKNQLTSTVIDGLTKCLELQASVLTSELNGNWLQRSWRPILMLLFGFVILYSKFIAPCFHLSNAILETDFWDLLKLGMGGYVIGRSVEKVADTVTSNIDMTFKKKKDRAE